MEALTHAPVVYKAKPLDSHFTSLADALYSYHAIDGFERIDGKAFDHQTVRSFNYALGTSCEELESNKLLRGQHYFESMDWIFKFVADHKFSSKRELCYYLLDSGNRPIAFLTVDHSTSENLQVVLSAPTELVKEFYQLVLENVRVDKDFSLDTTLVEVVPDDQALKGVTKSITNPRKAEPEYYPYLEGGSNALMTEFLQSDESVLILLGPPGTGKSSFIAAETEALDLLPIYAKQATVTNHPGLINYVFTLSDSYMEKVASSTAARRRELFIQNYEDHPAVRRKAPIGEVEHGDSNVADAATAADAPEGNLIVQWSEEHALAAHNHALAPRGYSYGYSLSSAGDVYKNVVDNIKIRVPVIVIEDAELLMSTRASGNKLMAELLNETDGVTSNHARKLILTANATDVKDIEEALMRAGRCYGVVHFRLLTPEEAIAARKVNGQPDFETVPTEKMALADALRKPRKKIVMSQGKAKLGFGN